MQLYEIKNDIASNLKRIRNEKGITQSELAAKLHMSQSRFCEIEKGKGSLSAEEFIWIVQNLGLPLNTLVRLPHADPAVQLKQALFRFGAHHLTSEEFTGLSESLSNLYNVIRETLVLTPSKEHLCALAPVIVKHIQVINLDAIAMRLYDLGIDSRLWWVTEGTLWAVRSRLKWTLPRELNALYKDAETLLTRKAKLYNVFFAIRRACPQDVIDQGIITSPEVEEAKNKRDELATRWRIITRITQEDFALALKNSEEHQPWWFSRLLKKKGDGLSS